MVIVFWNPFYFWWPTSFVPIYLVSDFFFHLDSLRSVLVLDLFLQIFNPVFLVIIARELINFHFVFGLGFFKRATFFCFDFSFTIFQSFFESSFFMVEEVKVVMLLRVGLVVKFVNFVTNFRVNSSFLGFACYVIDTFLAVLLFNVLEAIIIAHDGKRIVNLNF